MSGWSLAHPAALAALLLLPLLALLARTGGRTLPRWTGSLALWRRAVAEARPELEREPRRLAPHAVAALAALALALLALAGPVRRLAREGPTSWTLVVDRTPSMFLPADPACPFRALAGASDASGAATRLELAVLAAAGECERAGLAPESRRWITYAFDGVHEARGEFPPRAWLAREWGPGLETPWAALDTPRHVFVSDRAPDAAPLAAGCVFTGAVPVPGPVADLGDSFLEWDGARLVALPAGSAQSNGATRPVLALDPALPLDLARFARAWADARGFEVGALRPALSVTRAPAIPGTLARAGRLDVDGLLLPARGLEAPAREDLVAWARFTDEQGASAPAVSWRPGRVEVALEALDVAAADPAAFAVAWGGLFDRAALGRPAVVPWSERTAAGGSALRRPQGAPEGALQGRGRALAPWLAASAALAALLALGLSRRPGPGRPVVAAVRIRAGRRVRSSGRTGSG